MLTNINLLNNEMIVHRNRQHGSRSKSSVVNWIVDYF